jgi:hypothetical protein
MLGNVLGLLADDLALALLLLLLFLLSRAGFSISIPIPTTSSTTLTPRRIQAVIWSVSFSMLSQDWNQLLLVGRADWSPHGEPLVSPVEKGLGLQP